MSTENAIILREDGNAKGVTGGTKALLLREGELTLVDVEGVETPAGGATPASLVTALAAATDEQAADMRESLDVEESQLARARLARWRDTLNSRSAPVIGLCGDSMMNQVTNFLTAQIQLALNLSGIALKTAAPSGGAAVINDPARWFTWDGSRLSGAGHIGAAFEGSGIASQTANTLKVYYISQPGGGNFKIQTKKNAGAWTDEAAYLSVATSGTLAGNVITITKTDYRALWDVRCVWVSGSVDIIGFAAYHTNMLGARIAPMMGGGTYGNMVDWNTMPAAISNPIFADIGLDLVLFSHLDGVAGVNEQQAAWQEKINRSQAAAITTITSSFGSVVFNTASPHGLAVGDSFKVKGSSNAYYNEQWFTVTSVTDSDTVQVTIQADPGNSTGGSLSQEPTWVCIGPPMGPTNEIQTANLLQAAAMKSLAYSRGDVYWDNNRWAISPEYGLKQNFLIPTDVHYTVTARRGWTSRMISDLGLFISADRAPLNEGLIVTKGGFIRRDRSANLGAATDAGFEIGPVVRLVSPDGASGGAYLMLENSNGPTNAVDGHFIRSDPDGLTFGSIGFANWAMRGSVGFGARFWSRGATVAVPDGSVGTPTEPFRSLWMGKTITAAGTTAPQTIDKICGSINFAAGDASKLVTNVHAIAPTSAQTGSIINATVRTNDATMKSVAVVCSANGSFTLHANAAPTGETRVDFAIFTP